MPHYHAIINGNRSGTLYGFIYSTLLILLFAICQTIEYKTAGFTLTDSVYGSTFYSTNRHSTWYTYDNVIYYVISLYITYIIIQQIQVILLENNNIIFTCIDVILIDYGGVVMY